MTTYIKIIFIISIVFNFSYSDTLENIQELSIKEDAKSQYELGKIYRKNGEYKKAFEYFQKSANQGYDKAEFIFGYMYSHGEGIEKDYQKAIQWYEKSANQNNSNAQSNLGNMYRDAEGVAKDIQKAIQWYEKSANQGNPYAYYNLGAMYLNGKEVKKDYKKAVELLKKSLNQKDKLPQEYIDKLCKIVPEVCTSTNIEQKPSFDCKNIKKDSVESLICKSNNLSKLDVELNEIYKKLLQIIPEKKELIQEQREFLKERETCNKNEPLIKDYCIKEFYENRIYTLNTIYKFINIDDFKNNEDDKLYLGYEIKSKLYVKKLFNTIDIFDRNYILVKDGFLFQYYGGGRLADGLYYANIINGTIKKLFGGNIGEILFLKNFDKSKIVFKEVSGHHGLGGDGLYIINIQDDSYKSRKEIVSYIFYMESYFCGLENLKDSLNPEIIEGHKVAGHIEDYQYDEINNLIKLRVIEQDCSTNKYKEKILLYDLVKDTFDNDKTIEQELFYDDKKDILIDKQGNIKDKF